MNMAETAKIIATIQEIYPHFMDGRTPEKTVTIWQMVFDSEPYKIVSGALVAFVSDDNKGFPPVPGQIKEKIAQMDADNEIDEARAWALVYAAMCKGATEKEFNGLPCDVQRIVGSQRILFDWSMMDLETVNSVVASNFMRSYRARAAHTREVKKLPESVQRMYKIAGDAFSMDRAFLPAAEKPDMEPAEEKPMPDSVKSIMDGVRKKAEQEQIEAAHNQTRKMMKQMFGVEIGGANDD